MPYKAPGITVNQLPPQSQPSQQAFSRTICALFTAPQGPDYPMIIDPSQSVAVYGDPASPASSGYSGPAFLQGMARQQPITRAYGMRFMGCRVGVTRAAGNIADNAAGVPFIIQGIGIYAGSKGNALQVVVNAAQVQVAEIFRGNSISPEVQVITFYKLGGSPTGGVTLGFNGTNAGAPITAATITGGGAAAALQTYLTGIATIGASNAVVIAQGSPVAGAFSFQVTFAGTLATGGRPLLTSSAQTFAAGTGIVPVQSIVINDLSSGSAVAKQTITAGQYSLSTNGLIFQTINAQNPLAAAGSIVQAITLSGTAGLPQAQSVTLAGGADGLGATASDSTIAPLLATSLMVGNADFLVAAFDASAILGAIQTNITAGLQPTINQYRKAFLGPAAGTPYATLTSTYQTANSDRVLIVGNDALYGINPVNGQLNYAFDGFYGAAAIAAIKAQSSPEQNLYGNSLVGFANIPPIAPDIAAPLTPTQMDALAGAGYTVCYINPRTGQIAIRDLINTAQQTDVYGQPNRFIYVSERDCFDLIAILLLNDLGSLIGTPATAPANVGTLFQAITTSSMARIKGTITNGAVAQAVYDPIQNIVTINVGYGDRPPLNQIIVNISPIVGFSN